MGPLHLLQMFGMSTYLCVCGVLTDLVAPISLVTGGLVAPISLVAGGLVAPISLVLGVRFLNTFSGIIFAEGMAGI